MLPPILLFPYLIAVRGERRIYLKNYHSLRMKSIQELNRTSGESEATRPKGRGFPVRYFSFILCPLTPASRAGLAGHLPVT